MSNKFRIPKGIKTVLITGASGGIGEAFVDEFARLGLDCVLVGNEGDKLKEIADRVKKEFGVKVLVIDMDLSVPSAAQKVYDYCQGKQIEVDVLVNNVGTLIFHEFSTLSEKQLYLILNLHIYCTTFLTYLFGTRMLERKKVFIINMSSASAMMTLPGIHLYNATKSYIRNFSRSIYYEFIRSNVGVTVVCPSGVDTPFFKLPQRLRNLGLKLGLLIKPKQVAEIAIRKAFKFKKEVYPGLWDSLVIFVTKNLTDPVIFWLMDKLPQFKKKKE